MRPLTSLLFLCCTLALPAQAPAPTPAPRPGPVGDPAAPEAALDDDALVEKVTAAAGALRQKGALLTCAALQQQFATARTCELAPAPRRQKPLAGPELYAAVRRSTFLVATLYECTECDELHVTSATGCAIGADGRIATCAHVLQTDPEMRASWLCVADYEGNVAPVRAVVAGDLASDVCVLQVDWQGLEPLPLRTDARVGEPVWCLSNPDHQFACFTSGIVARWLVAHDPLPEPPGQAAEPRRKGEGEGERKEGDKKEGDKKEGDKKEGEKGRKAAPRPPARGPAVRWLQVTADFARGSSGGPIVDACGNLLGIAQSTTTVVYDEDAQPVDTQMVFKTASPAAALQALLRPPAAK